MNVFVRAGVFIHVHILRAPLGNYVDAGSGAASWLMMLMSS